VNAPKCPVDNYNKEGAIRVFPGLTGNPDAYLQAQQLRRAQAGCGRGGTALRISGDSARYDHREGNDDFGQVRALFRLFDQGQRQRLFSNVAEAMQGVPEPIVEQQLGLFERVDPACAAGVRAALAAMARQTALATVS